MFEGNSQADIAQSLPFDKHANAFDKVERLNQVKADSIAHNQILLVMTSVSRPSGGLCRN